MTGGEPSTEGDHHPVVPFFFAQDKQGNPNE